MALEVPGPKLLAALYGEPWLRFAFNVDAFRAGSALLTRPTGSAAEPSALNQRDLAGELLRALQRLPERSSDEAGRPYRDLRLFITEASPAAVEKYLAEVLAHLRRLLPAYRPPAESVDHAPAKTAAERLAAHRERVRADEEASAREWLAAYLADDDAPAPGSRVPAAKLYADADKVIGAYAEDEEEREDGGLYRVPRQRVFFAVADELLGARKRGAKGITVYTIPGA